LLVRSKSVAWADVLEARLAADGEVVSVVASGEPSLPVLNEFRAQARDAGVDAVIAVGGGAAIDLGKALAALVPAPDDPLTYLEGVGQGAALPTDPLPFAAVPSTAGTGAEVTKNAVIGVPEAGRKVSLRDPRMLPGLAIIDPSLTEGAPLAVTLSSGLDAITQVIEPYVSARANPLTDALCRAAIPMGLAALQRLSRGEDAAARDAMAYVSLSGGLALANAGLGAVHGLAGVIGGRTGAPHGLICGRLLGPVLLANARAMADQGGDTGRFSQIAEWIGEAFGAAGEDVLHTWEKRLSDLGVPALQPWLENDAQLHRIAAEASGASSMRANPVILSDETLVETMRAA
jgi:alcohol dehydrogenase class IV